MDIDILRKIGFKEHEIKIYLALLTLGPSTATKIGEETNIDRATTYRFLSSLIEKGFVSYCITNNVKYFSAAHPTKLTEDLRERLEQTQDLVPQLEKLLTLPKEETKVELYKGKKGFKTIMKEIAREKKPYTFIGEVEKFFTELPVYIVQWLKQVDSSRIKGRLICNENIEFKIAKTESYKLISKDFISRISTWTYGKKTALFIWSATPFGIVIDDEDVTHSNLSLFNFLWNIAKKPSKQHLKKSRLKNSFNS